MFKIENKLKRLKVLNDIIVSSGGNTYKVTMFNDLKKRNYGRFYEWICSTKL